MKLADKKKLHIIFENDINCLTVEQFMKAVPILNNLSIENIDDLIPVFTNITADLLDFDALNIIYTKISKINYNLNDKYEEEIIISGETYKIHDFEEMSFEEYIHIKDCFKDIFKNLNTFVAIVYREKLKYKSEKINERLKIFKDNIKVGQIAGIISKFNSFDESLNKYILKPKIEVKEEYEDDDPMQKHIKRWGFYITLNDLTEGNILNHQKVLKMKIKDILIYYTFKELDKQVRTEI